MKGLLLTCTVFCCTICSALTPSWTVTGSNPNTRRVVPDGLGNVVLVSDSYIASSGQTQSKIGWQKFSPSGTLLGGFNTGASPIKYEAVDAAVCGAYLGVLAYQSGGSVLSLLVFPLSGGAPTAITVASGLDSAISLIKATPTSFYVYCSNGGTTTMRRYNTAGSNIWTTNATLDSNAFAVARDNASNDWPSVLGTKVGSEWSEIFSGSNGSISSQTNLTYQTGYSAALGGFQDACLDSTGKFIFALGSSTYTSANHNQEIVPNVQVYPVAQSKPIGSGSYNFPLENTPATGIYGNRIASRPVSSAALGVYGVVSGKITSKSYDSFATVWNPAASLLGLTPTTYLHSVTSPPTMVAADSNFAYFAGGGTLYEHNAASFALTGSIANPANVDLQAIAGEVFLVGASSMTCYTP